MLPGDDVLSPRVARRFVKLSEEDGPLQPFLERLLPALVEVFRAKAGQIWLRAQGGGGAWFAIRYRMDTIENRDRPDGKHERIVQLAWQQRQPMMVEPQPKQKQSAGDGMKCPILFGPIVHLNGPLALIEIVLPAESHPIKPDDRKALLHGMQIVIDLIHSGLQKRMNLPMASMEQAQVQIKQLEDEIQSYHLSIQKSIEARLRQFQGWAFSSFAENQEFAKMVHRILDEHGLRVRCPECSYPSILRCLKSGNSKNGVFVFDHYLDGGRTFHGGPSTFPVVTVLPKPARRISLSAS